MTINGKKTLQMLRDQGLIIGNGTCFIKEILNLRAYAPKVSLQEYIRKNLKILDAIGIPICKKPIKGGDLNVRICRNNSNCERVRGDFGNVMNE